MIFSYGGHKRLIPKDNHTHTMHAVSQVSSTCVHGCTCLVVFMVQDNGSYVSALGHNQRSVTKVFLAFPCSDLGLSIYMGQKNYEGIPSFWLAFHVLVLQ